MVMKIKTTIYFAYTYYGLTLNTILTTPLSNYQCTLSKPLFCLHILNLAFLADTGIGITNFSISLQISILVTIKMAHSGNNWIQMRR